MERFKGSRYIQIRNMDIANGEYIGCAVYFQGCPFHCFNCFNPETWDFDGGKEWTEEITQEVLKIVSRKHLKRVSFLGGEPMIDRNLDLLSSLISEIKRIRPDIQVWIYSGFLLENLLKQDDLERYNRVYSILSNIDVLVDGQFKDDLKNFKMKFRGSENQRIINVKESLLENKIILRDDLMKLRV